MSNPFEVDDIQTDQQKAYQPFKDALMRGKVQFSYTKKDGSKREAIGTTCPELIPADKQITTAGKKEFDHIQNYYDFTVENGGDWRAMIKENLIDFTPIQ